MLLRCLHALPSLAAASVVGLVVSAQAVAEPPPTVGVPPHDRAAGDQAAQPSGLLLDPRTREKVDKLRRRMGLDVLEGTVFEQFDKQAARESAAEEPIEQLRTIAEQLDAAEVGEGVLVLTDMFGGTPSNMSLSFLDEHHVEVVTGINLPMLIKLATLAEEKSLEDLARFIKEYGQRNISVASELLPEPSRE